jgi:hypothetical protein
MIEGVWAYVTPAYALTIIGLGALALATFLRARHWAARARDLDRRS